MGKVDPLPATVQSAAVRVCRDALHWRDDLRAVFLAAGVPAPLYDKYDHLGFSKAKLARAVFNELQERGQPGFVVQRKIVQELCRMTKPHPDAPDQVAGKASLADLKREATAVQILAYREHPSTDLESVLGATPQEFESPILRHVDQVIRASSIPSALATSQPG